MNREKEPDIRGVEITERLYRTVTEQLVPYQKRHGLTAEQVIEDLLRGVVEDRVFCVNCRHVYYNRYSEVIDLVKCPNCGLDLNEQERARHPELRKTRDGEILVGHSIIQGAP